ncbi:MAG: response regulator [Ancalomicrobiaceae bacterium]|nr:response regulator [Ancalomicrobiaceae bacterium]
MQALIVDDNATNIALLQCLIAKIDHCQSIGFTDPSEALQRLPELDFDIALVDFVMPKVDGLELVRAIRALPRHAHVPIVMITTAEDRDVRIETLTAGANDFLAKPIDPVELRARVVNLLALRKAQQKLEQRAGFLEVEIDKALKVLVEREEEIVWRLSRATEGRDPETGGHIRRMGLTCRILAEELGLDADICRAIPVAAQMHDIGKVGIPDNILFKPGPLTPEERAVMQTHAMLGEEILSGSDALLVRIGAEIAGSHHEHWNGKGYPRGLAGEAIPIPGRIAAVADVFDALISERPYKRAWTLEAARDYVVSERGRQFDPACVDAFLRRYDEIVNLEAPASATPRAARPTAA